MSRFPIRTSLFDEFFRDLSPAFVVRPLHGDPLPEQIKLDVKESDQAYSLLAELPGVAKDDIHVSIDGGMVTVRAEVKQQLSLQNQQQKDERLVRSERYYGSVARSVQLPMDIDDSEASAKFENGLLALTLPKRRQQAGQKRLRID